MSDLTEALRALTGTMPASETVEVSAGDLREVIWRAENNAHMRSKTREQALRFRAVARDLLANFTGQHTSGPGDMRARQDCIALARQIVAEEVR